MAVKKEKAGVEDIEFGTGKVQQYRNGQLVDITQINASHIPIDDDDASWGNIGDVVDGLTNHIEDKDNPHGTTKTHIGLSEVDNTSDMDKPVSTAVQAALDSKLGSAETAFDSFRLNGMNEFELPISTQTKAYVDAADNDRYAKSEHIAESEGSQDAGKPIILNQMGKVDVSMLDVQAMYIVGSFTPVSTAEYPDTTGETHGAMWSITGVDASSGYTFTGGDLAGLTGYNGDYMVYGTSSWLLIEGNLSETEFYKLNGSQSITAPFAGGGQQIKNIAPASEAGDAVEYSQIVQLTDDYLELDGTNSMKAELDFGGFRGINIANGTLSDDACTVGQTQSLLAAHTGDMSNPHNVDKAQVGLGFVVSSGDGSAILANDGTYISTSTLSEWWTLPVPNGLSVLFKDSNGANVQGLSLSNSDVLELNETNIPLTIAGSSITVVGNTTNIPKSDTSLEANKGTKVNNIVVMTQAEYNSITPNADTLYFIVG